jgi:hypothetical protein
MKTDGAQRADHLADYQAEGQGGAEIAKTLPQTPPESTAISKQSTQTPGPQKPGKLPALSEYDTYGKYASAIVRQILFADSRFNNSKLVMDSVLSKLQVKGGVFPPDIRLGTLGLTRFNAATVNFSKAATLIESAAAKRRAGKDATDDIVSATAFMGEGFTEISAGLGTDVGNYVVKQWQTELGKTSSTIGTPQWSGRASPGSVVYEAGSGTPIPESAVRSDIDGALVHLPSMSSAEHDEWMGQSVSGYGEKLDEQLRTMHDNEKQHIIDELEKTPDGSKPSRLTELSEEAQRKIDAATTLAEATKREISKTRAQNESDFSQLEEEMKPIREQLKSGKYTDPDVAGLSPGDAAKRLGVKLLSCRRREEETAQNFELLTEDMVPNLDAMAESLGTVSASGSLQSLSKEERTTRLEKLKTDFREDFIKYQDAMSKPTANLTEWAKISPALKSQIGPAAINTAFTAADLGAKVDDYIKKVSAGTVSEEDRWKLAGSVVGLVGGMSSFLPVVGPLVSIGLSLVGIGIGNFGEKLDDMRFRNAADAFHDEVVDDYRKKHPNSVNYVYPSDVGSP